jgi:hypothetical protein
MVLNVSNSRIEVQPGDPAFNIMTNLCSYFELGEPKGDDVWLEGQIIETEFVFNGRLFLHDGGQGTLIDNFPKGPTPSGWSQTRRLDAPGYQLFDNRGQLVFSYGITGKVCIVDVNLYKADGSLAAHGGDDGLIVQVRTKLGRKGICVG